MTCSQYNSNKTLNGCILPRHKMLMQLIRFRGVKTRCPVSGLPLIASVIDNTGSLETLLTEENTISEDHNLVSFDTKPYIQMMHMLFFCEEDFLHMHISFLLFEYFNSYVHLKGFCTSLCTCCICVNYNLSGCSRT